MLADEGGDLRKKGRNDPEGTQDDRVNDPNMDFGGGETPGGDAILAGNLNSKSDMEDVVVSPDGPDGD